MQERYITSDELSDRNEAYDMLLAYSKTLLAELHSTPHHSQIPEWFLVSLDDLIESHRMSYSKPATAEYLRTFVREIRQHLNQLPEQS